MVRVNGVAARALRQRDLQELQDALALKDEELRTTSAELGQLKAERELQQRAEKRAWVKPAVLSSAVTLAVAVLAAWAAWSTASLGADEDRERESRDDRSKVYAEYLSSARAYVTAKVRTDLAEATAAVRSDPDGPAGRAVVDAQKAEWSASRAWQTQADLLFVYGSDAAWSVHRRLQDHVGDRVGIGFGLPGLPAGSTAAEDLASFQIVFCREVPATPRAECGVGAGGFPR